MMCVARKLKIKYDNENGILVDIRISMKGKKYSELLTPLALTLQQSFYLSKRTIAQTQFLTPTYHCTNMIQPSI